MKRLLCKIGIHNQRWVDHTEWIIKMRCSRCGKEEYIWSMRPLRDFSADMDTLSKS